MSIATINPATGETVRSFEPEGEAVILAKLALSAEAFAKWRRVSFQERARHMTGLAELFEARQEEFATLMALEMGKPLAAGRDEALKCAAGARYYAANAQSFLADESVEIEGASAFVRYQPLGTVLAIMPWNFPFWQVVRFAAPALMAGNVALLKHASNVPQCALALERVFLQAGFPEDAFQTLLIDSGEVEKLIEDPRIAAVTLTGSEAAGRKIAAAAGRQIKKTVLELGGSDPFIVMPTSDLPAAIKTAVKARNVNSGQSCIAAKRFIIHRLVYEEFAAAFVAQMKALRTGDPRHPETDVGPLATRKILESLEDQVRRSRETGAVVLTGGQRIDGPGNYFPPTVLAGLRPDSQVCMEEFFGPVALLFQAESVEHAIELANGTNFRLGASAWTRDAVEREQLIDGIQAGQVFVNGMVASDPRLPFGGVKHSGYGRELGAAGIREFVNAKTVWIKGE